MKRTILLFSVLVLATAFSVSAQTAVSYKQQAWDLGNKLSQAALSNSMLNDPALTGRTFTEAKTNAKTLGIVLPDLPSKTTDKTKNNAEALYYLLNTTGKPIIGILTEDFGAEHAALFEISFKTNILLLLYEPNSKETAAIVNVINKRRTTAKLPENAFSELITLIGHRSDFNKVKDEIFLLQNIISKLVGSEEFRDNGTILYEKKEYAKSVAEFTRALQLIPNEPEFLFLRARSYMGLKKYLEAIADYTNVVKYAESEIEINNLPTVYHNRGLSYGLLKKYSQAIADLNKAAELKPDYASVYRIRSLLYREMGNKKLADADFQTAESLQPGIMK